MKRILVANRGEIAVRIMRTIRELGLESVAIYSDADQDSYHRALADYSCNLPGNTSAETYLNIPAIIDAIKSSGADAVHPGYGFLSENADFAEAVEKSGAKFIGPKASTIRKMGDKVEAKKIMKSVDVPVVPGSDEPLKTWQEIKEISKETGYPLILKAAAGGGGRGMRIVHSDDELQDAFESCTREAQMYFGNPAVFCERYVKNPRHIEFQVLFDEHGNGVHLFERDCSIQRRHQKLIEEAPSLFLNPEERARLGEIAIRAGQATDYRGVGTVEFICESPEKTYFMEMNTRIQVEHPVTEMITGVDLIREQILVAQGHKLSMKQEDLKHEGWSFEARINAEDFLANFAPSSGKVENLRLPGGPFVRTDTHLYSGYEIPTFYDSMIAKLIVWGKDREAAMNRLQRALSELSIEGIKTTCMFHEAILRNEDFRNGNFDTGFLAERIEELKTNLKEDDDIGLQGSIASVLFANRSKTTFNPQVSDSTTDSRTNWTDVARNEMHRK